MCITYKCDKPINVSNGQIDYRFALASFRLSEINLYLDTESEPYGDFRLLFTCIHTRLLQDLEPCRLLIQTFFHSGLSWQASRQSGCPNLLATFIFPSDAWSSLRSRTRRSAPQIYLSGGARATCPSHLSPRDTLMINGCRVSLRISPFERMLILPVIGSLLGPKIRRKT